jgi:hypothetical protein
MSSLGAPSLSLLSLFRSVCSSLVTVVISPFMQLSTSNSRASLDFSESEDDDEGAS